MKLFNCLDGNQFRKPFKFTHSVNGFNYLIEK